MNPEDMQKFKELYCKKRIERLIAQNAMLKELTKEELVYIKNLRGEIVDVIQREKPYMSE